jgi:hypothetical protein
MTISCISILLSYLREAYVTLNEIKQVIKPRSITNMYATLYEKRASSKTKHIWAIKQA